ncbi:hypothetical protein RB195_016612 [Necator americanus]|uniref:AMP-binding enzyme n=1 Tax=Necator americanus TaxID=51031 RepID=A0ABR1C2V0_NECAM
MPSFVSGSSSQWFLSLHVQKFPFALHHSTKSFSPQSNGISTEIRIKQLLGYGHLDVSCQVMPNCIEYAVFYLGALLCGGAMSGASAMFTDYELERQFVDSVCKVVITDETHLDKVLLATKRCSEVKTIICVRCPKSTVALPDDVVCWDDVIKTPVTTIPKYTFSPDDAAVLPYSSGTTGSPKGVMLTHKNFSTMLDIIESHFEEHIVTKLSDSDWNYHNEKVLLMLPFYHIFGFGLFNHTLLKGATGIIFAKFESRRFLDAIQTYQPKLLMLVPPILSFLTKHPMAANYNLSSLRIVLSGAAPAGKDLCDDFLNKYKNVRYLGQGDIGFVDEKGQTFIVDRLKELIKVKGLQVAPAELEDILLSHKEIQDAAVIGVPDEKTGEKPRAYVVKANKNLTESDVKDFIEAKVSSYKFLTGGVVFVEEIPKSPSGKILRRFLREQAG